METALRPYLTAGLAVVSAGAIVMAPVAPPAPNIQVPDIALTGLVEDAFSELIVNLDTGEAGIFSELLHAIPDPLSLYALDALLPLNLGMADALQWANNPMPVLGGMIDSITSGTFPDKLGEVASALPTIAQDTFLSDAYPGIPGALSILSDQLQGSLSDFWNDLTVTGDFGAAVNDLLMAGAAVFAAPTVVAHDLVASSMTAGWYIMSIFAPDGANLFTIPESLGNIPLIGGPLEDITGFFFNEILAQLFNFVF